MAQSVERLTSAQVMILRFMSSSPVLGFMLTAGGLEPASDSVCVCVCVSLSLPLPPLKINIKKILSSFIDFEER